MAAVSITIRLLSTTPKGLARIPQTSRKSVTEKRYDSISDNDPVVGVYLELVGVHRILELRDGRLEARGEAASSGARVGDDFGRVILPV